MNNRLDNRLYRVNGVWHISCYVPVCELVRPANSCMINSKSIAYDSEPTYTFQSIDAISAPARRPVANLEIFDKLCSP